MKLNETCCAVVCRQGTTLHITYIYLSTVGEHWRWSVFVLLLCCNLRISKWGDVKTLLFSTHLSMCVFSIKVWHWEQQPVILHVCYLAKTNAVWYERPVVNPPFVRLIMFSLCWNRVNCVIILAAAVHAAVEQGSALLLATAPTVVYMDDTVCYCSN